MAPQASPDRIPSRLAWPRREPAYVGAHRATATPVSPVVALIVLSAVLTVAAVLTALWAVTTW
jgi:hypothetical protein